jgi:uncharacterized protein (TIGR02246 family)
MVNAAEVATVLDHYAAAILAGDHATLDALLDADYQFVSARAQVVGRDQRLTTLAASPQILASLTFSDLDVRFTGSVALVRAAFIAEFRPHTGRTDPDHGISTFVFSRDHGRWRLRHQHNSHKP